MYKFVDTTESATNHSLSLKTVFNDHILDEVLTDETGSFITLTVNGRGDLMNKINLIELSNFDGLLEQGGPNLDSREIIVKFKLYDETNEGFRDRVTKLFTYLEGTRKTLEFLDEDLFYYATLSHIEIPDESSNDVLGEMIFLCSDPYKYSKDESTETLDDTTVRKNEGSEATEPIIELTAKKKTTFAMINNMNDEYNLIGYPLEEEGNEEIVDAKPSIFKDNGEKIDEWSTNNIKVDTNFIDISGSMMFDGTGFRTESYGTGDKMHGPALLKTLPKSLQDFEIVAEFDIISQRKEDNWRMEVYFLDEGMNMLGKMGVKDNNRNLFRRHGLGRVGPYRGAGLKNGYAIGSHNYKRDDLGKISNMHLRVKREGNLYTFYMAERRNQKHTDSNEASYRDTANAFNSKLKYIEIFIGNYKDRRVPTRLRIDKVEVFELLQVHVDQTPYILDIGDTVTFDHENEEILINGEDAMRLKDFGAEFFKLHRGYNQLEINPPDTFDSEIKYRKKFK